MNSLRADFTFAEEDGKGKSKILPFPLSVFPSPKVKSARRLG